MGDKMHSARGPCIGIKNLITKLSVAKYLKGMESIFTEGLL